MFPPPNLPSPGQILLVTDELSSPADFILHRSLSIHIKGKSDSRCLIVSVSEDLARWKAIAAKSNINLSPSSVPQSFVFIDIAGELQGLPNPNSLSFNDIYNRISDVLSTPDIQTLVIMDDITSLEWIGISSLHLIRFARALRALCQKSNASLIIRHHIVTPEDLDDLFRSLLQICTYHMDVRPLSSGKSGSVSGVVALHAGPATCDPKVPLVPRSLAVQYRLTDTGSIFFERGTSGGVL